MHPPDLSFCRNTVLEAAQKMAEQAAWYLGWRPIHWLIEWPMDETPPPQKPAPTTQLPTSEEIKMAAKLLVLRAQKRKALAKDSPATPPTK
ncbi:MAG: hypothetical protein Q8S02_15195 [Hydrogenophaga sp.]|nr:hypothetical protein [Hydrogenophaga sp.]